MQVWGHVMHACTGVGLAAPCVRARLRPGDPPACACRGGAGAPPGWARVQGRAHPPAEVVEHHDVGVHVVQVVAVGRVLLAGPDVRAGALVGEHVVAVLGLVIHAVEPRHLRRRRGLASSQGR